MKLIKCNRCALINTESDSFCRRCKQDLATNPIPSIPSTQVNDVKRRHGKQFSFFLYALIFVAVAGVFGILFWLFKSYNDVKAQDEKRIEMKQKEEADALQSQKQSRQQLADQLKNAKMPNLTVDVRNLNNESMKALQPTFDKMQKENDRMRETAAKAEELRVKSLPPPSQAQIGTSQQR